MTAVRRVWMSQPLRSRLALITTALITTGLLTTGLLIASLSVTSLLSTHLIRQIDDQLRVTAQTIGRQGLSQIRTGEGPGMPSTYYVEAQYLDGTSGRMISDDTAADYGIPKLGTLSLDEAIKQEFFTADSNLLGQQWRVLALPITSEGEYTGVVAIALPLRDAMQTVERTRLIVAFTDISVILLGAGAATYLVRRAFRPLRQIERVAGRIASGDLSSRVPNTEPPTTEVGSLQRALNTMLQRNEQAFDVQVVAQERMTRFVSDASHELRTPLAAIRGYGELYRMGGVPPERTDEVMGRIESEASRMGRLVDDLLQLARMDEGREMTMDRVNLTALAAGALTDMMVLAPQRGCALIPLDDGAAAAGREAPAVTVIGDKDRLSQVMTNLLGNVVRHTPEDSPVEVAVGLRLAPGASRPGPEGRAPAAAGPGAVGQGLTRTGRRAARRGAGRRGRQGERDWQDAARPGATAPAAEPARAIAVVEVRDHGPGVSDQDAEKVFRRFYRADTSRNRQTGGSGLGLAIVSAIIERHGGTVRMDRTPGGGATVHIEIPALLPDAATKVA
ncbi:HAMP domain-containing sensor histidine kinase [Actinomyces israelii]|uniref:histidine kinase n=1 Tax=Actinomyces israelii TaxID=1659 RepID=A0ABT4I897_9ACTO|nr:HAMP domain-containing sensor histidine kinase [Actinomyces israelii]MCZ0857746.1 HAMP domain-containing sensor histidine kinase [Actinomyces israelii]